MSVGTTRALPWGDELRVAARSSIEWTATLAAPGPPGFLRVPFRPCVRRGRRVDPSARYVCSIRAPSGQLRRRSRRSGDEKRSTSPFHRRRPGRRGRGSAAAGDLPIKFARVSDPRRSRTESRPPGRCGRSIPPCCRLAREWCGRAIREAFRSSRSGHIECASPATPTGPVAVYDEKSPPLRISHDILVFRVCRDRHMVDLLSD